MPGPPDNTAGAIYYRERRQGGGLPPGRLLEHAAPNPFITLNRPSRPALRISDSRSAGVLWDVDHASGGSGERCTYVFRYE
jgi:hypothetical protein